MGRKGGLILRVGADESNHGQLRGGRPYEPIVATFSFRPRDGVPVPAAGKWYESKALRFMSHIGRDWAYVICDDPQAPRRSQSLTLAVPWMVNNYLTQEDLWDEIAGIEAFLDGTVGESASATFRSRLHSLNPSFGGPVYVRGFPKTDVMAEAQVSAGVDRPRLYYAPSLIYAADGLAGGILHKKIDRDVLLRRRMTKNFDRVISVA